MAIDSTIKKKVIEDWKAAFPYLSMYSQNKLYKLIGPLITGIELLKLPRTGEYRPYFVIYSLCGNAMGNDIKACLEGPIVLIPCYDKKGFQFDIHYEKHDMLFRDAADCLRKQSPLSFEKDLAISKLYDVIYSYSNTAPLSAAPNSYLQAALQKDRLKVALYIGIKEAEEVLDEIIKRDWDTKSFKNWNVDIIDWFQSLHEIIANRDNMMKQIEINRHDKKIAKLQSSELIP